MKTTLLHLEPHDSLVSIRDRMDWAKTPRILLVWPPKEKVDIRPLDLTLLRRYAAGKGAQLGLVTGVAEIQVAAREFDIPCFKNVSEAQKKAWPGDLLEVRPARRFPRSDLRAIRADLYPSDLLEAAQRNPPVRLGQFALGVLALLALMLIFIPSAEIRITPPEQVQQVTISVSAAPDVKTAQISGAVPMQKLTQTLETEGTALGTGRVTVPDGTAQGVAHLTNHTRATVIVPAGTVLLTRSEPPAAFVTVEQVEVPSGAKAAVKVPIQAAQPGSQGNAPAEAIRAFEGPLGLSLEVTNPLPVTGGSDTTVATPSEADFDYLRSRLLAELERNARAHFAAQMAEKDVLLLTTFQTERVYAERALPAPGESAEKLSLSFRADFSVFYVQAADLEALAALVLDASLPAGSRPAPETLTWQSLPPLVETPAGISWQVRAERRLRLALETGQMIALVTGRPVQAAGEMLEKTFGLVESPEIRIRPGWWPWLPFIPIQIKVVSDAYFGN